MAKMSAGDTVVAVKDIGGLLREHVPKGSKGVVTKASWGEYKVLFTIERWHGDKKVEVRVEPDEVA
ncbi:hypothetical protein KZI27_00370 (plasmid) [Curtobacterium sp. TC1]|jgi:hypothetical protein|uniref:hypothetical protein n=1 Tax=unclassified Curtobacterium TaxID=257496 RepID=UPI001052164A|nr:MULTISPECIES: hypothetical protein [unclassified Curtobacterium]QZQ53730.1 hypothetical protein KZI27_00370 [Curtobacterium sp. TC1]TCU43293.1 hypothetical protein EDF33_10932 [Curtobacterium sp. PhB146]